MRRERTLDTVPAPPMITPSHNARSFFKVGNKNHYWMETERKLKAIALPYESIMCCDPKCNDTNHKDDLLNFYNEIILSILTSGVTVNSQANDYNPIPGWNEFVAMHHAEARECYIEWRNDGKPRFGPVFNRMTQSRLTFKRALRHCKKQNNAIIENKIAINLKGNPKKLWSEINKKRNYRTELSDTIENAAGGQAICEL